VLEAVSDRLPRRPTPAVPEAEHAVPAPLPAGSRLPFHRQSSVGDVLDLQRSAGNRSVAMLLRGRQASAAPVQRADLRGEAREPEAAEQREILEGIAPGAFAPEEAPAPGPAAPEPGGTEPAPAPPARARWTGYPPTGRPMGYAQWRARARLKADLRAELVRQLDAVLPGVRQRAATYEARRLPTTRFEGPGEAAKTVTDDVLGAYTATAALTPSQAAARHAHRFTASGAGRNLLDAYSVADRRLTGSAVSAESVLWWAVDQGNAPAIKEAQNFSPRDWNYEERWLYYQVIVPVARARGPDLRLWDRFGFALAPGRGRILIGAMADAGPGSAPTAAPTPLEVRAALWDGWMTLVHEYIHTLEHPTYRSARSRSDASTVLNEGMTEYFTKQVLDQAIPRARADEPLRRQVEGLGPADAPPPITERVLPATYQYNATYRPHVERVLAILPRVREEGLRAAFLQGHVEYLGLTTAGAPATPVAVGTGGGITVPASITTLAGLAALTGVGEALIRAANPGVSAWSPLPARAVVPGWREHLVVEASDERERTAETPAQVAAQHGISVADLERVNRPLMARWPALAAGDRVLVPPAAPAGAAPVPVAPGAGAAPAPAPGP
jgi:hypothetical protein